ncbi:uncharacterized protein LOC114742650 [Neltuma alba]|uniref:uncharacterized protein LOC114742650 n=1 Tax=Neltuma alba TaxID=207710 RepID=UPI0010A354FF|nr:uncharacterized protein LOC114742650 [Prosopis alba]
MSSIISVFVICLTSQMHPGAKHCIAYDSMHFLWKGILNGAGSKKNLEKMINKLSGLLFDAAYAGNFDFLAELIKSSPDLMWQQDDRRRTIIHIAVPYCHPKIFNLIHDIHGSINITSYTDIDGNNILHLAPVLASEDRLELVCGVAFQMKLELLWFEEVRKIMLPSYMKRNSHGFTPYELFSKEHFGLHEDAESWMKTTANSCMVVSNLIGTGVFSAAFSLPGGTNSGVPNYLWK